MADNQDNDEIIFFSLDVLWENIESLAKHDATTVGGLSIAEKAALKSTGLVLATIDMAQEIGSAPSGKKIEMTGVALTSTGIGLGLSVLLTPWIGIPVAAAYSFLVEKSGKQVFEISDSGNIALQNGTSISTSYNDGLATLSWQESSGISVGITRNSENAIAVCTVMDPTGKSYQYDVLSDKITVRDGSNNILAQGYASNPSQSLSAQIEDIENNLNTHFSDAGSSIKTGDFSALAESPNGYLNANEGVIGTALGEGISFTYNKTDGMLMVSGENFVLKNYAGNASLSIYIEPETGNIISRAIGADGKSRLDYVDENGLHQIAEYNSIMELSSEALNKLIALDEGISTELNHGVHRYIAGGGDILDLPPAVYETVSLWEDSDAQYIINGINYIASSVVKGINDASGAISTFIQHEVGVTTEWLTHTSGARTQVLLWLSENALALGTGELDADEAFVDFAQSMASSLIGHVVIDGLTKAGAVDLLGRVFESQGMTGFGGFKLDAFGGFVTQNGAQVKITSGQALAVDISNMFANFAASAIVHSGEWDAEDYVTAATTSIATLAAQKAAMHFFPDQSFTSGAPAQFALAIAGGLFQDASLNRDEYIQLGVQAGIAASAYALGVWAGGGVSNVVGNGVASTIFWNGNLGIANTINSAVYSAFGYQTSQIPSILAASGGPAGIIISAIVSYIAPKVLSTIFGGGKTVFYDGEYATMDALLNSVYQVQQVTINGSLVNAVVAVDPHGSVIIMKSGFSHAVGGSGSDTIVGDGGSVVTDDVISGGAGSDYLEGKGGDDTLLGQDGHDHILGGDGNDIISGGTGEDEIFGDAGDDIIVGEDGDDFIHGGAGVDSISGGNDKDIILASAGDDNVDGGAGDDVLELGAGDDTALGGSGNDIILGNTGSDSIDGGDGNDDIFGEDGNDRIDGGSGRDHLFGGLDTDILSGGTGDDLLDGGFGNDLLDGGLGKDVLYADQGDDVLLGGLDDDLLDGGYGADNLDGGAGADVLYGGGGNDTLDGGEGGDKYIFRPGDGEDTISDADGADMIVLDGVSSSGISFAQDGDDLVLSYGAYGDKIRIVGQMLAAKIETLELSNGVIDLTALTFPGGSADYTVDSLPSITVLSDINADLAAAAADRNTKLKQLADSQLLSVIGQQTWHEMMQDQIENVYYNGSQVEVFSRSRGGLFGGGNYLVYRLVRLGAFVGTSETYGYKEIAPGESTGGYSQVLSGTKLTWEIGGYSVEDVWLNGAAIATTIKQLSSGMEYTLDSGQAFQVSAGGTDYSTTAVQRMSLGYGTQHTVMLAEEQLTFGIDKFVGTYTNESVYGNGGDDYVFGGDGFDQIFGGTGNDWLFGGAGDDFLRGQDGDDVMFGGAGNDTLNSEAGDDWLSGGAGNDSLASGQGGNDYLDGGSGTDLVTFQDAVSGATINLAENIAIGNGWSARLVNIEKVIGTPYVDVIIGDDGDNVLDGSSSTADQVYGGGGNDRIVLNGVINGHFVDGGTGVDTLDIANTAYATTNLAAGTVTYSSNTANIANIENVLGSDYADTITGNDNDNVIEGKLGNDIINGAGGRDTVSYSTATSYVYVQLWYSGGAGHTGVAGQGTGGGVDTLYNIENVIGSNYNDYIEADTGNNVIDGGLGADLMYGFDGNDIFYVDNTGDQIGEPIGYGTDTVYASVSYNLQTAHWEYLGIEQLFLTGASDINATGNALDNLLVGNSGNNTLDGGTGADTMMGGAGNDIYIVNNTGDVVVESYSAGTDTVQSSVTYTISANVENLTLTGSSGLSGTGNSTDNTLTGNSGNNTLNGGGGNDTLNGGSGTDTLVGGTGDDIYVVDTTTDTITESSGEGSDTVQSSVTFSLASIANVENVTLTGSSNINATGNSLDNILTGNAGNNTLTGGTGNDIYIVNGSSDVVVENTSEGTDTVQSSVTWTLASNIENLTLTGSSNINGTGNSAVNILIGNTGNNTLDGGTGADTLSGGAGDDIYIVDNASDVTLEYAAEGVDTVQSSVSYALASNVENIMLTGSSNINGTGNSLNNTLTGNAGANTLAGGIGDDTYVMDSGSDTIVENALEGTDTVQSSIAWTLGSNLENLTLMGSSNINGTGNSLDNVLTGNSGNNILTGNDGNDTLEGGGGTDTLIGGLGDDVYVVDTITDTLTESSGEGADTVRASVTFSLSAIANIENLTLTGSSSINATGNSLNNTLTGNAGTNTLTGGAGNDTYIVDSASDVVVENASEGTDTVQSGVTYTLSSNVENLTLTGTGNINGTGNSGVNILTGNSGNNTLDGGAGADTLVGGAGDDIFIVDDAGDVITEVASGGADTAQSSISYTLGAYVENLTLTGSSNINATGNSLDNVLTGNSGINTLTGGAGNDTYVVNSGSDVVVENTSEGVDTVQSSVTYTLSANVENLTLTGSSAINATGNSLNNILTGNSGTNTLTGGTGDDTYVVDSGSDIVVENASEGTDTIKSGATYTLSSNVENLTLTGTGNINATGNSAANILAGNAGNNTLDGSTGADTLSGGIGDDTYVVDNTSDVVIEGIAEGADTVQSGVTYTLSANVENLTLTGSGNIAGTGNGLNNVITGNSGVNTLDGGAGNDTLDGGAGADTMSGGAGDDVFIVDNASDVVTENTGEGSDTIKSSITYTLGSYVENLILTGSSGINGTGNTLDNVLTGNAGVNTLTGGSGNDTLDGGTGADTMIGGTGDDVYVVDNASDVTTENASEGADTVRSSVTRTLGSNLENLVLTGAGNINGTGNSLDNVLTGNAGTNTLTGGTGNDTYIVDSASDVVVENSSEGTDTVQSGVTYTLSANVENLTLTGLNNVNGTGNSGVNTLTGNNGDNTLDGGAGADTMVGGLGSDIYVVDNASDVVTEGVNEGADTVLSSVTYTLGSNLENLTLTGTSAINGTGNSLNNILKGNSGVNTLTGGAGNDTLDGGIGTDTMAGGTGDDTYIVDNASDVVTESSSEGIDTVQSGVTLTLGSNIENLLLTGTTSINGTGNSLDNVLTGNSGTNTLTGSSGNDTLDGGTGADSLIGGTGDDIFVVDDMGDIVTENASEGTDTVRSYITYALGSNVENVILLGTASTDATGNSLDNVLTGSGGVNVLSGAGGNDTLDGGAGADTLIGGSGDDIFVVDDAGDVVTENVSEGADTVQSSISYTLGANVERLTLTGGEHINAAGNSLANILTGNNGNNMLDGGTGADTMTGGTGNDTYIIDDAGDAVTENADEGMDTVKSAITYTLGSNVENLVLTGTAALNGTGNTLNNVITGNSGVNTLSGGSGNDTLDGGAGADTLTGGTGDDVFVIDDIGDFVVENSSEGTDTIRSSIAYILGTNFENLVLTGAANINGTGNSLDNVLTGNLGVNTLTGGAGNDTYIVDSGSDVVVENASEGTDTVQSGASYTLSAHVEHLTLIGLGNTSGTGNSLDNVIIGNVGDNILDGGSGTDALAGGAGNDIYMVDTTADTITENADEGIDTVSSSVSFSLASIAHVENLTLTGAGNINATGNSLDNILKGNSGINVMDGGDGNDTLYGGDGADHLTGGSGADIFMFEEATAYNNVDTIADFSTGDGDAINIADLLEGYDPLNDALTDFVQISNSSGNSTLSVDADGAGMAHSMVQIATLTGVTGITDEDALVAAGNLIVA